MPWLQRLRNVFRAESVNEELDSELAFHLAETADRLRAAGMTEEEARRAARRRLGNYSIQKESTRDMDVAGWLDAGWADLKYALRQIRLNPGFATVAIVSLGLGIGANTAIFQLLDAIRLRGLPVTEPARLATLDQADKKYFIGGMYMSREQAFTYAQMDELRKQNHAFSDVMLFWPTRFNLSTGGESRYADGLLVSANYLDVLGVRPIMGHGPLPANDKATCPTATAVLSYSFWQRAFGGDPSVLGKTVTLEGHRFAVGGVTPGSFFGVEPGSRFDVALPLCTQNLFANDKTAWADNRLAYWLTPIGRLKPGWTVERASADIRNISPTIFRATLPEQYRPEEAKQYLNNKLKALPANAGISEVRRNFEDPLWILLGITGAVLLIACLNLANLLLARASAREREMAVRQAVGASRLRLLSQVLLESLTLAVAGAGLGLLLAQGMSRALVAFLQTSDKSLALNLGLDWQVFGFLALWSLVTCLLFGLAPAIRAGAGAPIAAMRGARTSTSSRERNGLRRSLVVAQVALSLVLLVSALLFSQSLRKLLATELGFDSHNVLVADVTLKGTSLDDPKRRLAVYRELEQRFRSMPDVASVASLWLTPLGGAGWNGHVHADNDGAKSDGKITWFNRTGPGYFATLGTQLLAGREFNAHDDMNAPKISIVNQAFAKQLFGSQMPVGRSFRLEEEGKPDSVFQIVGVVANSKYRQVGEDLQAEAFFPMEQDEAGSDRSFVIRGRASMGALEESVQRELAAVSPNVLVDFQIMDVLIEGSLLRERLMSNLSVAFGILAACLSALGLYGVVSYMVARRRSEIGIRMAIGASRSHIYRLVARDALLMVSGGLVLGVGAALGLSRYAETLLYGLKARDPLILVSAGVLLALSALLATWVPARRAARLDPMTALREE